MVTPSIIFWILAENSKLFLCRLMSLFSAQGIVWTILASGGVALLATYLLQSKLVYVPYAPPGARTNFLDPEDYQLTFYEKVWSPMPNSSLVVLWNGRWGEITGVAVQGIRQPRSTTNLFVFSWECRQYPSKQLVGTTTLHITLTQQTLASDFPTFVKLCTSYSVMCL